MNTFFKVADERNCTENWLICGTYHDTDNHDYYVTSDHVHASEIGEFTRGAKGDAELIAALLNWYYYLNDDARQIFDDMQGLATRTDAQDVVE